MNITSYIYKICSKSTIKPELNSILFNEGKIIATDSYKLIEITPAEGDTSVNGLIGSRYFKDGKNYTITKSDMKGFADIKDKKGAVQKAAITSAEYYPKYEEILQQAEKATANTVSINRQYLIDLLEAMPKTNPFDKVILSVSKDKYKPVLITNNVSKALLMPMTE